MGAGMGILISVIILLIAFNGHITLLQRLLELEVEKREIQEETTDTKDS